MVLKTQLLHQLSQLLYQVEEQSSNLGLLLQNGATTSGLNHHLFLQHPQLWETVKTGGSIVRAKRNKLDPENVNKLVYLRENLGKVTIDKLILEDEEEKEIEQECLAEAEKELKLN